MRRLAMLIFGGMLGLTLASGYLLYNTNVFAEDTVISDVSISVPVSCEMSSTLDSAHTATINNGTYRSEIGVTTFTVFCNDNGGFSIYTIGYSGEEYGNTKLLANVGGSLAPTYDVVTGTATSGATSNWAMKLTAVAGTYAPTLQNGFGSYRLVPDSYTKAASFLSTTDVTTGSKIQSTYAAYMSNNQPAGTYSGKVKYTLVHPTTNVPNEPKDCTAGKICYWPNAGNTVVDSMGDQTVSSSDATPYLWNNNFKRQGYGFAGWSTTFDYSDTSGFLGTNETIDDASVLATIQSEGLSLYAHWIKSAGTLQGWTGCGAMGIGDVTALTDSRNNDTYAVAKLADGNCWMIENLRLDYDGLDNSGGSLAQGYGGVFAGLAEPETEASDFYYSLNSGSNPDKAKEDELANANSLYYVETQSGTATIDIVRGNYAKSRLPRYENSNKTRYSTVVNYNGRAYGNGYFYNFAAAMANTSYFDSTTDGQGNVLSEVAGTSICPSGWQLPYGGTTGNGANSGGFAYLDTRLGGTGSTAYTLEATKRWRRYPNNFALSGSFGMNSALLVGSSGAYWSSTVANATSVNSFVIRLDSDWLSFNGGLKPYGYSVRCLKSS